MNELQEYKDLYHDELNIAENLNSKITNSITLLTIIGTANVLLLSNLFPIENTIWSIIYLVVCIANIIIFVFTIYHFLKAYTGRVYNYFSIRKIQNSCNQYKENILFKIKTTNYDINNIDQSSITDVINKKMEYWIINEYLNCATFNRTVNAEKSQKLYKLTHSIIINIIIVFISFVLYIVKINLGGLFNYVE